MKMPEEVNRILTDQINNILFCPTDTAINNLINDGFEDKNVKIIKSGDIMYDNALFYKTKIKKHESFGISGDFILATIHRQENTDNKEKLTQIINSFNELHDIGHKIVITTSPQN